jgi:hypothetical protein
LYDSAWLTSVPVPPPDHHSDRPGSFVEQAGIRCQQTANCTLRPEQYTVSGGAMHFSGWKANHDFRAFNLGLPPVTLMLFGGLEFMQISLLIVSLPTMVASVVMSETLVKFLKDNT